MSGRRFSAAKSMMRRRRDSMRGSQNQYPDSLLQQRAECGFQLSVIAGFYDQYVAADFSCGPFKLARLICSRRIFVIDQDATDRIARYEFADQIESFCVQVAGDEDNASSCIAAWPIDLWTKPAATGSPLDVNTIGIVEVAVFATCAETSPPTATSTSTRRSTSFFAGYAVSYPASLD